MTKIYDTDCFNEQTYDIIIKKQEKVGENLTPDNFDNIDFNYIVDDDLDQIEYLPEAIVNGVDIGKLYEVINYMNLNKTQLNSIVKDKVLQSERTTLNIEIPDNYDGRNSFVMVSYNQTDAYGGTSAFFNQRPFLQLINKTFIDRDGDSNEPYIGGYNIIKNKREITVNFDGLNDFLVSPDDSVKYISAKILVLLWRLK